MDLVPIKVKIKLKENGHAKYPDFNSMDVIRNMATDWSAYIDAHGSGWQYDQTSGHKEETPDSPFGQQWGMILVPKVFADEALLKFPDEVSKMTEAECETFYDTKAHVNDIDYTIDEEKLKYYETKLKLGKSLKSEEQTKLDELLEPDALGSAIKTNKDKKWATYKVKMGINVIQ